MKRLPRLTWQEGMVLNQLFTDYTKVDEGSRRLVVSALRKNDKLVSRYLRQEEFDVYFACSLRSREDFEHAERICREIETVAKKEDGGTNHYCRSCGSLICRSDVLWMERRKK